jgi:hypothetical protein
MVAFPTYRISPNAKAEGMANTLSRDAPGKQHPMKPKQFREVIS